MRLFKNIHEERRKIQDNSKSREKTFQNPVIYRIGLGRSNRLLILLGTGLDLIIGPGFTGPDRPTIILTTPIRIGFLLIAVFFYTMCYEIDGLRPTLIYGPWFRYPIDIEQIKSIRRRDIEFSLACSYHFPGLALFTVPYRIYRLWHTYARDLLFSNDDSPIHLTS